VLHVHGQADAPRQAFETVQWTSGVEVPILKALMHF